MSERSANYWIMQCGEHLLQIHAKERTRKRIVISKLYANFKHFFFLDLRTEDHQLRMKTDRLYIMFRDIHKINNIVEMKIVA